MHIHMQNNTYLVIVVTEIKLYIRAWLSERENQVEEEKKRNLQK